VRRALTISMFAAVAASATLAHAADFTYRPPGELVAGSGRGRVDTKVYAPGMRFPIENAPAYANSQVWGAGGSMGPGGGQCATSNYSYPWHDNYCESRSWDMPLCPAGTGHQGQDIRAGTCAKDVHWAVAAADGTITNVGSYSVYLTDASGTRYDYLHMSQVQVSVGAKVKRGQRLGKVSNVFGGTPTTIHLHFNLRQTISGTGTVYVPPYMSLVRSYEELVGPPPVTNAPPTGLFEAASCDEIRGTAKDPDAPDKPIAVRLYIDGAVGDPAARLLNLTAGPAFTSKVPLALQDGKPHELRALAVDSAGGPNTELPGGPKTITCAAVVPDGVRRHVTGPAAYASWNFDPLWSQVTIDDGKLSAIPRGADLPAAPKLQKAPDAPEVYLIDSGFKRHVPNVEALVAWEFDGTSIEEVPASELEKLPSGPPVRERPYLVKGAGPEVFLIDDAFGGAAPPTSTDAGGEEPAADASGDLDGSCGCRVQPAHASRFTFAWIGVALLLLRRRHRS